MFKKLKQKINEEQSPQRNAQSSQQAQMGGGDRRSSQPHPIHHDVTPSPSDREMLAGMIAEPAFLSEYTIFALDHSKRPKTAQVASVSTTKGPARSPRGSINGDGRASPQKEESQSFAQKLQLKVPSVESLIRGGASRAESLFRSSSKENLVRSPSRDSLTPQGENEAAPSYDPPSDIESEAEEAPGSAESLSKEQLLHRLLQVESSLGKYRGKYSELVTAYRTVQREKEKTQAILSQSQDKALRRIGELREELQMDQQAKKHLQEEFDAALEEKDQMITVLQTQVALLKKRTKGAADGSVAPDQDVPQSELAADPTSASQTPSEEQKLEPEIAEVEGNSDPAKLLETLQKRVTRQENLLQKCKDVIRTHKDRSAQLSSENETLHQQLQERLQELEKMKELHTTEKTKLITQLRDAKNLIEQLEQDKGMVIAETKRQMHETLEMKEDEIAQLRSRLQQVTAQKEEIQDQREKGEKSAFEELERALSAAQKAEEARKQLQVQLDERMKEVERASEEERKSLQQELTRVKQEVVSIMKKSSEETVSNLEKTHREAMAAKEEELKEKIHKAVEQCKEEFAQLSKEQEQQASLALEDSELQKSAIRTEADVKVREIQLELEAARTRILELESSVDKISQESGVTSELSSHLEKLKSQHKEELAALEEKHQEELLKHKDGLTQQHNTALQELIEKHRVEVESLVKDKEMQFQTHIEDMNQKTLEKLDAKQAELEAVSAELSEVLKSKRALEEKLLAAEDASTLAQQEQEKRFQDLVSKQNAELENSRQERDQKVGDVQRTLEEKLSAVLSEKEKEIEQLTLKEKTLEEKSHSTAEHLQIKIKELEDLQQSLAHVQIENRNLKETNTRLGKASEDLDQCKKDLMDLKERLEAAKKDFQQTQKLLQEAERQLEESKKELLEKEKSHAAELDEQARLKKRLEEEKAAHEKKLTSVEAKLKAQETKMEKFKQKAKEMQENFKKKLQQTEENAKKELAKKEVELQQKEQQVQDKIVEMGQKSSQGLSSAVSELQSNHREELEKLHAAHKHEVEDVERRCQEKLAQQEEEVTEKHSAVLQEKSQELNELSEQLNASRAENERLMGEMKNLKEDLMVREMTVQKLQEELDKAAVKLETLSRGEALLKEQYDQVLNERNSLKRTEEESRDKLKMLSEKLKETEEQLEMLKNSKFKENEDLQSKFEETSTQLQANKAAFQQELVSIITRMDQYCQDVQSKVENASNQLQQRVEHRVEELNSRLMHSQENVGKLQKTVLTKLSGICTLEDNLHKHTEEKKNLCISLEQMAAQVNAQVEQIKALTQEKEGQSQHISDQAQKLEEMRAASASTSEDLKTKEQHLRDLESIIADVKNQLLSSINEKEEAISQLSQQHEEERRRAATQMKKTVERLEQEKKSAQEQADALRNSLSEHQNTAKAKLIQQSDTIASLQSRLEEMEQEISKKNDALQRLEGSFDNQSISKSEMDQLLSEKEQRVSDLTSELERCRSRLDELQQQLALKTNECEQLASDLKQHQTIRENEKKELVEQLQQMHSSQNGNLEQEMVEKLHSLEEDNQKYQQELGRQREEFERMKAEFSRSKESSLKEAEERLSAESARKVSELKKKAELKISQIQKTLTAQIEEKEQMIKALQSSLEENRNNEALSKKHVETLEVKTKTLEESLIKLKEEQEKQLQQILSDEKLQKEKALEEMKSVYEEKLISCQRDAAQREDLKETESALKEIQAKLTEAEEQNENLLAEINRLKERICEKDVQLHHASAEKLQDSNRLEAETKVEASGTQRSGSEVEDRTADEPLLPLKNQLSKIRSEKEKIQKDFTRLQKDMRVMRKEHEQDLEYMKKELLEENDKKLKQELEDLELKHNSNIKQLMREVNTQMALKEKELDTAVKETIAKAQAVEAELISSHREEASQLRSMLSQKEEDLHRTVQKYEHVIQNREDEMGDRVWQVQKQLEELQTRFRDTSEVTSEDLQAQLAEKTTLLSEARLKEQGFIEKIHSLEDKIKFLHRSTVVTHLGSSVKDPGISVPDALSEATEMEYLRKVLFEYMMGRETKTMAKVITSMLKFPPDQAQKVLDKEDSKPLPWLR
ncbi:golgin subfamily A member 4 isoform X2 [Oryzias latipes]|uniref:golgin subfamily A member 4 isoform X2 n=1 Tax=Oryzias latipes TaxID=8090 RepID=UPI000CE1CCCB|nr:golgin subfamily A member 4 isoform X2 [Oryzias latipes]